MTADWSLVLLLLSFSLVLLISLLILLRVIAARKLLLMIVVFPFPHNAGFKQQSVLVGWHFSGVFCYLFFGFFWGGFLRICFQEKDIR